MKKEFIPYEQALALKELGFDEPCFGHHYFNGNLQKYSVCLYHSKNQEEATIEQGILAPTFSQAFRFFREKYGLNGVIEGSKRFGFEWCIFRNEFEYIKPPNNKDIYEEAELACLEKLIEITKTK